MRERPEFHPDPEIDSALPKWSATATYMEVHAARRLFDTWSDLEAFFRDVVPRSTLKADGVYHKGGWRTVVDPGHVLRVLEELDVQRDELPQATLIIMNTSSLHRARNGYVMSEQRRTESRAFIEMFRGVSLADLLTVFYYTKRKQGDSALWIRGCFDEQLPATYIRRLRQVALRPQEWPPARLGELYRSGVPAEYPAHFWNRSEEFWALHEAGVPFEYAKALHIV